MGWGKGEQVQAGREQVGRREQAGNVCGKVENVGRGKGRQGVGKNLKAQGGGEGKVKGMGNCNLILPEGKGA